MPPSRRGVRRRCCRAARMVVRRSSSGSFASRGLPNGEVSAASSGRHAPSIAEGSRLRERVATRMRSTRGEHVTDSRRADDQLATRARSTRDDGTEASRRPCERLATTAHAMRDGCACDGRRPRARRTTTARATSRSTCAAVARARTKSHDRRIRPSSRNFSRAPARELERRETMLERSPLDTPRARRIAHTQPARAHALRVACVAS
jgi:hypothetical protein